MHKIAVLSLAAACLLASGAAMAQDGPGRERGRSAELTRDQIEGYATQMFERMDVNGDGFVNRADQELRNRARFDRLDADNDGVLSFAEFNARREISPFVRSDSARFESGPRAGGAVRARTGMNLMRFWFDRNAEGSVSQAEFTTAALQWFDNADANGDGRLTAQERRAAARQMSERFRADRDIGPGAASDRGPGARSGGPRGN